MSRRRSDPVQRFWSLVDKNGPMPSPAAKLCPKTPCWIWKGSAVLGYGRFWIDGGHIGAHIYSYELAHGSVPSGLELDHLCRRPICVNPEHEEAVTHAENVIRGMAPLATKARNLARTHCKRGHPITEATIKLDKVGKRARCLICARERARIWMRGYSERKRIRP